MLMIVDASTLTIPRRRLVAGSAPARTGRGVHLSRAPAPQDSNNLYGDALGLGGR